jgi:hypothetical protein
MQDARDSDTDRMVELQKRQRTLQFERARIDREIDQLQVRLRQIESRLAELTSANSQAA